MGEEGGAAEDDGKCAGRSSDDGTVWRREVAGWTGLVVGELADGVRGGRGRLE